MAITIRNVAQRAGGSVKTVSRVINNEPMVSDETRARVLQVMHELGYVPNVSAQHLARGHAMVIGLLFYNVAKSYLNDVLEGCFDVARQEGYSILTHRCDVQQPAERQEILQMVAQRRVDGFIFTPPCDNSPELLDDLQKQNAPFVRLNPHDRHLPLPHVTPSDYQGAFDMTARLLTLGHRRIGFILGSQDHSATHDRLAGFRDALASRQVPFDPELVRQGDWDFQSGVTCARELFALKPRPTAIFAGNDDMAAGVLNAAHRSGLKIPEQLSVAGFDDVPLAQQVWPPLTTVRQPTVQIAELATRLLVDLMKGNPLAILHYELQTELVMRESTMAVTHMQSNGAEGQLVSRAD